MERPIFFSLLIIISAYIPLFTLERVERRLFTPMAFTVCYALLGSMLLALTLIPVLATYLFRNGAKTWDNPVLRWLYNALRERPARARCGTPASRWSPAPACRRSARSRSAALLGSEFLPQLDEGVIWVRANLPAGISLEKSAEMAAQIRRICRAVSRRCSWSARNPAATMRAPTRTDPIATSSSWR